MLAKIIIISFLVAILASLGSALYFLIHDRTGSQRTVKALTWRISLSLFLFILLMLSYYMGWIQPHGMGG